MKIILVTILFVISTTQVFALDIIYRYLTFSMPDDQVETVGELAQGSFIINGKKDKLGKNKFEMVLAADFERFCPSLADRNPGFKLDCLQKDRIALLDQISVTPTLQRFFGVVNDLPKITRQETEHYVLYSAFSASPMIDGVTSVIVVKSNHDTVIINGYYTLQQLKMLDVGDWVRRQ
ncbi:MAG: hypothetical protein ACC707_12075 [Thiohalomonadales bacterium]